jgi:hypothetical protein
VPGFDIVISRVKPNLGLAYDDLTYDLAF